MPESYWTRTRLQYRLICELIEQVDVSISGLTMLSFANNLYFVCIQLLKSMNTMPSVAHFVYFYASLSFLLGRTLAVSLYLSEVTIVHVAGTIVTYELVLIQFHEDQNLWNCN
ncbi:unnamed protein product [Ceratitis capitata]|uniref:(Mediterranean fruit fly) hypothetical protein n=1 Tax=Ceratitis capitata TaxID=7213 RepID=A0A811V2Y8_CERCA|nr:unnamed protein product [Ceratitis capitata]